MKILAIADIHLQGHGETDQSRALMKAAQLAEDEAVDLVVVAGDIYDAKSTVEHRLQFRRFLDMANRQGARPVVVIRGNHDEALDLALFDDPLSNIYVSENPDHIDVMLKSGDSIWVHTIPHFNAGALAAMAESKSEYEEAGTDAFSAMLGDLFQIVRGDTDQPHIVVAHAVVSGAQLDNGQIPRENGIHLNQERLLTLGCPVILGHIHCYQEFGDNVFYCGAPERHRHGEGGDKGGVILEHDGTNWSKRFVSFSPRPWMTIEADWMAGTGGSDIYWHFYGEGPNGLCWNDDDAIPLYAGTKVKFRYRVKQKDLATVDIHTVKRFFEVAGVAELKLEQVVELSTAVRCAEINQADSVRDCLKLWGEQKQTEPQFLDRALNIFDALISEDVHKKAPERVNDDPAQVNLFDEGILAHAI